MLRKLLSAFTATTHVDDPALSARVSLTALLVQLARADHDFADEEAARITAILKKRFGLDDAGADALLQEGIAAEDASHDSVRFTRVVKDAVPRDERFELLQDFWSLVLADAHRDHEEDGHMRLVTNLLGMTDKDSALARQAAVKAAQV